MRRLLTFADDVPLLCNLAFSIAILLWVAMVALLAACAAHQSLPVTAPDIDTETR